MKSRGISQIELLVVLAVIAALAVAAWRLEAHGEQVGYDRAQNDYAKRDNEKLVQVQGQLVKAQRELQAEQDAHLAEVAQIDSDGQKKLREVEGAKDQFVSDVVAGRIRLFDPNVKRACSGGEAAGTARAATGVGDGAGGGELREEASLSLFLIGEATHADKVVVRLTACQQELLVDRKACNAPEGR